MSPKEYDCISFYDLNLKIEGHSEKQKRDESIQRLVAFSAYAGGMNKTPFEKIWPSPVEKSEETKFVDKQDDFKELLKIVTKGNG